MKREDIKRLDKWRDIVYFISRYCQYADGELQKITGQLGVPRFTDDVPTAAVSVMNAGGKIKVIFMFNPEFFDKMEVRKVAFIIMHEWLHVGLGHGRRFQAWCADFESDHNIEMTKDEKGQFHFIWNAMADSIINEMLIERHGYFKFWEDEELGEFWTADNLPPKAFGDEVKNYVSPKDRHYGLDELQKDFAVEDLMDNMTSDWHRPDPDGAGEGEEGTELDEIVQDLSGKGVPQIDDHQDFDPAEDQLFEELVADDFKGGLRAGRGGKEGERALESIKDVSVDVDWKRILSDYLMSSVQKRTARGWERRPRKIAHMGNKLLLPGPSIRKKEAQKVAIGLDISYSMDKRDIAYLAGYITAMDLDCDVNYYLFNSRCKPISKKDIQDSNYSIGGGTSFDAVEQYLVDDVNDGKPYPDVVIMLTDGYSYLHQPTHPERWCWLILGEGDDNNKPGKVISKVSSS